MGDYGPGVSSLTSQAPVDPPLSASDPEEISVLLTGFGPFKSNLVNASYLIASSLPPSFTFSPPPSKGSDAAPRRVSIHVHPAPVPVAYSSVRTLLPVIIGDYVKAHGGRRPDIIIHMGIAAMRHYYSVETKAHRDAYLMSDVKGKPGYEDGERLWRELDLPPMLQPGPAGDSETSLAPSSGKKHLIPHVPDDDFLIAWKSFCSPGKDVRISTDAGRYLCEFIFYASLALAYQEGQDRSVVFFHVPASCLDEDIEAGKEVAIALIKALTTSWSRSKA
ncbi:peptidase C15, pyroglutamyl peptidase I-like protein [Aspergillus heteromorphus CBS 117.55]|uniref:Peptidase C15, pyroglutamyl peptidase I-like protein n=1 Tax=Aspergillus heteromorphus CBS 117.55 TaxID=1448321 RepID=A0A317VY33_9EURO|nr:peptidase C15, pyroglutamyl peptidase I-like protein [Aspergillus heteromorphus CBS 117.55]PWY78241.1 peptidase C15, pyroglutamyl peptidase I-like protein [Aspergillus heteromorphus CBS 117.55]